MGWVSWIGSYEWWHCQPITDCHITSKPTWCYDLHPWKPSYDPYGKTPLCQIIATSLMIGFVVVSDWKQKPTSNIITYTRHRDNLSVTLIAFTWPYLTSTHASRFNWYIMGSIYLYIYTYTLYKLGANSISVALVICNSCTLTTSFKSCVSQYFKCFPNKSSVNLSKSSPFSRMILFLVTCFSMITLHAQYLKVYICFFNFSDRVKEFTCSLLVDPIISNLGRVEWFLELIEIHYDWL